MKKWKTLIAMTTLMIIGTIATKAPAASSVRIAIAVPGVEGRIPAHVEANGNVTIEEYPTHFDGTLKLLAMSTAAFGRTLNDGACQAVAARAALAGDESYPLELRQLAQDSVRKDNSFLLEANVVSFFTTSEFTLAAKMAAEAAGVRASSYQIVNPLTGRELDVTVEYSEQALSRQIGDLATLTRQLKAILQTTGGLATGKSQGEVSTADLLCDLRSGAARVVTKVVGSVDSGGATEPLFALEVARAFYAALKTEVGTTPDNYTTTQKLVAGGVATGEAAKAASAPLDARSVGVIAAKLFDSRTGAFVEVADGQIQQVLSAPRDGGERFEGQGTLVLTQQL